MQVLRYRAAILPNMAPMALRLLSATQFVLDALLRGVLHTVILAVVLARPQIWSSQLYKACATGGMIYLFQANARYLIHQLRKAPRPLFEERRS